jgi:hypothetical protein
MAKWQLFLNSLSTPGGNLLLLVVFVASLLGLVLHVLHHGDEGQVQTVILTTFSGFSGALLQALRGRSSDIPTPTGVTTTTSTATASTKTNGGTTNGSTAT